MCFFQQVKNSLNSGFCAETGSQISIPQSFSVSPGRRSREPFLVYIAHRRNLLEMARANRIEVESKFMRTLINVNPDRTVSRQGH